MRRLISEQGRVRFGIFETPIDEVNYRDYRMTTPMGLKVPAPLKRLMFNQFVFFGLTGPDAILGVAVVDLKYLANGFFYIYDRRGGGLSEASKLTLPIGNKIFISPTPDQVSAGFELGALTISIDGSRVKARARDMELDLEFDRSQVGPLRVCTRAGYKGWVYTEKSSPIQVRGRVKHPGGEIEIASPAYMGLMDWTAGHMRRETFWNWAATASTLADGRSLGLNLSCGVNETSFTENAFWVDGEMTKVDTCVFDFDPDDLYRPWQVRSLDGKVDLKFVGQEQRGEHVNAGLVASKFVQLMGCFEGSLKTDQGELIEIADCPGWAEDHYAKW